MENEQKYSSWPEGKCPLESQIVICESCGSEHFSIDSQAPRRGKKVPDTCDECGYRYGLTVTQKVH